VRPIARLDLELQVSGTLMLAIGAAGLFGALGRGSDPARAILAFAVAAAVLAAMSAVATRFVRSKDRLPPAAQGVLVEPPSQTMRRSIVAATLPMLAVLALIAISGGVAAAIGGVAAGVGLVDLANLTALRRRQAAGREVIYRELGGSPFAGGRRPLYTRPT
jgi:hypothetical protein